MVEGKKEEKQRRAFLDQASAASLAGRKGVPLGSNERCLLKSSIGGAQREMGIWDRRGKQAGTRGSRGVRIGRDNQHKMAQRFKNYGTGSVGNF